MASINKKYKALMKMGSMSVSMQGGSSSAKQTKQNFIWVDSATRDAGDLEELTRTWFLQPSSPVIRECLNNVNPVNVLGSLRMVSQAKQDSRLKTQDSGLRSMRVLSPHKHM